MSPICDATSNFRPPRFPVSGWYWCYSDCTAMTIQLSSDLVKNSTCRSLSEEDVPLFGYWPCFRQFSDEVWSPPMLFEVSFVLAPLLKELLEFFCASKRFYSQQQPTLFVFCVNRSWSSFTQQNWPPVTTGGVKDEVRLKIPHLYRRAKLFPPRMVLWTKSKCKKKRREVWLSCQSCLVTTGWNYAHSQCWKWKMLKTKVKQRQQIRSHEIQYI